ncbi:MAG: Crp/Fnr family transcriptional regulator [Leptolyngbyaceae cyanobacterium]|mgnify:CR=1 FL=1
MRHSVRNLSTLDRPVVHKFKRREIIPLKKNILWQIQVGTVRLFTVSDDGTVITLGFWTAGELTGYPLACMDACQIECLAEVEATLLNTGQCWNLHQVMLDHICQMQTLICIRHGQVLPRLKALLRWLTDKFGRSTEQGKLIQLRLTHQDIADAIGSTRVTVTRLIRDLEREGVLSYSPKQYIILHHELAA